MKYIYVLEDDTKLQQQILESLLKTEPQAQVRFFISLESFQSWLTLAMKEGQKALFQGGNRLESDPNAATAAFDPTDVLLLLISKEEWLGSRYLNLIKKTIEAFIRKSICTAEDPTRMIITAFEGPDFDFHLVEDPVISNILFKPFDDLILQQHLHYALTGHHPPSQSFVHSVQTVQEVEMTKEVQMEAVGDVGFVTQSRGELRIGQIAKYYGEVFKGRGRTHVMGRCIACEPHPEVAGEFRVWFSFFGIPSAQISDIRRSMVKRNETEYSGNSPFKEQEMAKEWVIIDSDKERLAKFKKILTEVAEAQVKVFSSFETFFFQVDPSGAENNRKEPPWVETEKLTLQLDSKGEHILKVLPEGQEKKKIFGELFEELQKATFMSKLHEISVSTIRTWVRAPESIVLAPDLPEYLIIQNQGHFFTLKVISFNRMTEEGKTTWHLELTVPPVLERTKWFESKFPPPQAAHASLIAEEYLQEEKLSYWEEFVKAAQEKGHLPRMMALYKQVPDEKFVRKLNWIEDIYENGNDAPYIVRKLKWRGSTSLHQAEPGVSAYLNACKELIRVANPVEVAEISEAGLVMNYKRLIEKGAFRKFVLSKTGESYIEYRATCNYSEEHPTEKGQFHSHFVFFGITDSHLKSIRVWILENFIQAKQGDEGGG